MIDNYYKEIAKRIHNEYNEQILVFQKYQDLIQEKTEESRKIGEDIEKYVSSVEDDKEVGYKELIEHVSKQIEILEDHINDINKKIDPIKERIDNLAKEEIDLWNSIKEKYHYLKDDDIVKEIQEYLK